MGKRAGIIGLMVLLAIAGTFAQATSQLAGNVRDAAGRPMPGILVELSSPALPETIRPVATDSRGRYRFDRLPAGTYSIAFTLIGFWTERRELQLPGDYRRPMNVRLYGNGESEPLAGTSGGASLEGTVLDQMQGVIPSVGITLTGPATLNTTSDTNGQFSFTGLQAGDYQLRAALEGFGTTVRMVTFAAGTKRTMRIELSVAATVFPPR